MALQIRPTLLYCYDESGDFMPQILLDNSARDRSVQTEALLSIICLSIIF